ncbi:hypothetical protein T484DRAFT_2621449, partial [Baffinella frigidus]
MVYGLWLMIYGLCLIRFMLERLPEPEPLTNSTASSEGAPEPTPFINSDPRSEPKGEGG